MLKTCIVVSDGARARFFVTEKPPENQPGAPHRLVELEGLTNPEGELRGNQLFRNNRSGAERSPTGVQFLYDEHRDRHRLEIARRFAKRVAAALIEVARRERVSKVVLAAAPRMLGLLRKELGDDLPRDVALSELAEDLSWHSTERISSALGRHGVFP